MIGKVAIGRIDVGIVPIGAVDAALEIVHHQVRGDAAKVSEHPLLDPDEGGQFLIRNKLPEGVRTERQHAQEKLCEGFLAAFSLSDENTVAEIDLGFFRRLVIKPNSNLLRGAWRPACSRNARQNFTYAISGATSCPICLTVVPLP